jgi:hypothetical protein
VVLDIGVGVKFDELFYVLEVSTHPLLAILLSVANTNLAHHVTSYLVYHDWVLANVSIGVDACSHRVSIGLYVLNDLGREVTLENVAHVGKAMIGHGEVELGNAMFGKESLLDKLVLVNGSLPEGQKTNTKVAPLLLRSRSRLAFAHFLSSRLVFSSSSTDCRDVVFPLAERRSVPMSAWWCTGWREDILAFSDALLTEVRVVRHWKTPVLITLKL